MKFKAVVAALAAAYSVVVPCASAQTPLSPPSDLEQRIRAEVREWTPWFWQMRETGSLPPEALNFQFTVLPYLHREWDPFGPAFAVFETIYADRLQLDPTAGSVYLLDDLLRDDPQVLAAFRRYTLTGVLSTGPGFPAAHAEHAALVYEAYIDPENVDFGGAYFDAQGNLISFDLTPPSPETADGNGQPPLEDEDIPQEIKDLRDWIEDQLDDSQLIDVPYKSDHPFWFPGFDCDDYTEAFWAWLKNHDMDTRYPGIKAESLWLYWRFTWGIGKGGKHGKAGHAVLLITYNGYYYIVDAMTGQIYGPFPDTLPLKDIDWIPFLDPDPANPDDNSLPVRTPDSITPHDPRDRPWNDPAPWHEDQDMRDHLEDHTDHPATDYIWISVVPS